MSRYLQITGGQCAIMEGLGLARPAPRNADGQQGPVPRPGRLQMGAGVERALTKKGRDHSRPLRFSAWRRYQVRRDMPTLSQGLRASLVLARSSIRGRPFAVAVAVLIGRSCRRLNNEDR